MAKTNTYVGKYFQVPAGVVVMSRGEKRTHTRDTIVRVQRHDKTRGGLERIWWKSNGYMTSALI